MTATSSEIIEMLPPADAQAAAALIAERQTVDETERLHVAGLFLELSILRLGEADERAGRRPYKPELLEKALPRLAYFATELHLDALDLWAYTDQHDVLAAMGPILAPARNAD
ncbi:MAG TPA: hypothetical protein VMW48_07335 [Vicinamibacterales bacterium]|nr:hypothetical protein [Vicinamibacterales bacterium]